MGDIPMAQMPYDERNSESGRYKQKYPPKGFIAAVDDIDGDVTTTAVSDVVGCTYRSAYGHLRQLEKEDRVTSRKIGQTRVWALTDTETDNE